MKGHLELYAAFLNEGNQDLQRPLPPAPTASIESDADWEMVEPDSSQQREENPAQVRKIAHPQNDSHADDWEWEVLDHNDYSAVSVQQVG